MSGLQKPEEALLAFQTTSNFDGSFSFSRTQQFSRTFAGSIFFLGGQPPPPPLLAPTTTKSPATVHEGTVFPEKSPCSQSILPSAQSCADKVPSLLMIITCLPAC